jgi:hypothetical protein
VRLSYLDYVRAWKVYGSEYFLVKPVGNAALPNTVRNRAHASEW